MSVLKHLCPTVIEYNTTINIVNTHVSNEWWGAYWHHRYDVDCDELTYDEANAILDWDRSDPFRLDRDDDGEACEANAHGDDVETVVYDSYPVGGVATGDGSTGLRRLGRRGRAGGRRARRPRRDRPDPRPALRAAGLIPWAP